jgi:hypothetical protein
VTGVKYRRLAYGIAILSIRHHFQFLLWTRHDRTPWNERASLKGGARGVQEAIQIGGG